MKKIVVSLFVLGAVAFTATSASAAPWHHHHHPICGWTHHHHWCR